MAMTDTRNHLRKVAEENGWARRTPYTVGPHEVDEFVREAPAPSRDLVKVFYSKRAKGRTLWLLQAVRYREGGDMLQMSGNLKAERTEEMLKSETARDWSAASLHSRLERLYGNAEGDAPGLMPAQPPEYRIYAPHRAQRRWVAYDTTADETEARAMLAKRREDAPDTMWVAARADITELDW